MSLVTMNMTPRQLQSKFFDRKSVAEKMTAANRRALSRFGAYVMTDARRSMRTGSPKPSKPGKPPRAHEGSLRKGAHAVQFHYDSSKETVVIGPLPFRKNRKDRAVSNQTIPETHEYGGVRRLPRRKLRLRGRGGGRFTKILEEERRRYAERPYMRPAFKRTIKKHGAKPWFKSLR